MAIVDVLPPQATKVPTRERARIRALKYAEAMAAGGLTRAALARRLGVSRAWVTKALRSIGPGEAPR
jgi:transcriptional regulator with XRE-family HTH domain